jgi:hypothetical protein
MNLKVLLPMALSVCTSTLMGCGQGTEPMVLAGDASQTLISTLILPISTTLSGFTPFSSTHDGFDLSGTFTGTVIPVRAPATGLVVAADTTAQTITILHNVHVYTRMKYVTSSVQVGNFVLAGQQIGTVANLSNVLNFSVLVDNVSVCPMTYLSQAARQQMVIYIYSIYSLNSGNPCLP